MDSKKVKLKMLNPNTRHIFLESLQPPAGYVLDRAITTTFSLDLLSLLMAPLSMSLFECQDRRDVLNDPIAVLEALKRTTNHLTVFCQQGRIAIPKGDTLLYRHLEPVVIEVQPPNNNGIFHPKIWLLRFKNDDNVIYRFLCLSKNLTFDKSWDTILAMDGCLKNRKNAFSRNHPLSDFIKTLPKIATSNLSQNMIDNVNIIAEEVKRVEFKTPDGFDDFSFLPSGIDGYTKPPSLHSHSRLMAMSPFLSDKCLHPLIDSGTENILISREDSLDCIKQKIYDGVESRSEIYIMDESAEHSEGIEGTDDESIDQPAFNDFSGLHGKLYISENGWNASILTGSANATIAAFDGRNVEFLVELKGKKSKIGIDRFLNDEKTSFKEFLCKYKRTDTPKDDVKKELENRLVNARRTISSSEFLLKVTRNSDGTFSMCMKSKCAISMNSDLIAGECYPISLKTSNSQNINLLLTENHITFNNVSILSLTSFIAFELVAKHKDQKMSINFVLNLPIEGLPPERDTLILQSIVSNENQFMRYLLFLLAEGDESFIINDRIVKHNAENMDFGIKLNFQFPLFEELVRAYSRNPEKIERISKLVKDLDSKKDATQKLLPEGFVQMWETFMKAREEEKSL